MSLEQMVELKYSSRLELADRVLDDLIAAAPHSGDATAQRAAAVLAAWDRQANPDSTGSSSSHSWAPGSASRGSAALFARRPIRPIP